MGGGVLLSLSAGLQRADNGVCLAISQAPLSISPLATPTAITSGNRRGLMEDGWSVHCESAVRESCDGGRRRRGREEGEGEEEEGKEGEGVRDRGWRGKGEGWREEGEGKEGGGMEGGGRREGWR